MILPLLILRRVDAVLQPTKAKVLETNVRLEGKTGNPDPLLKRAAGQPLYGRAPRGPALLRDHGGCILNMRAQPGELAIYESDQLVPWHVRAHLDRDVWRSVQLPDLELAARANLFPQSVAVWTVA